MKFVAKCAAILNLSLSWVVLFSSLALCEQESQQINFFALPGLHVGIFV